MSTNLTGLAPSMYSQTVANGVSVVTDQVAISHLLNYTGSTSYNDYSNAQLGNNTASVVLSQVANKSLIVTNNIVVNITATINATALDITVGNATFVDAITFNNTQSNVFVEESFQLNVTSPDGGVISTQSSLYPLSLTQVPSTNTQDDLSAWNYLRILNQSGANAQYNTANVANALGAGEGKVYFYENQTSFAPNFKNIAGYVNMASGHNMSYTVEQSLNNTSATVADYTYELVKMGWADPTFNITSTGNVASVVSNFTTTSDYSQLNAITSYNYTNFLGSLDYTGSMGNNISGVGTSSLNFTLTNNATATKAFTFVSGNNTNLTLNPTFVSIDNLTSISQIQNATYGTQLTLSVTANALSFNLPASNVSAAPSTVATTLVAENLPAPGQSTDNITLVFDTTARYSTSTTYSNFNATVVYAGDSNTSTYGSLTGLQLTQATYNYTAYMMAPPTYDYAIPNPGAGNLTANLSGLYSIYPNGSTLTVSSLNITNETTAFMGSLQNVGNNYVYDNTGAGGSATDRLLYLLDSNTTAAYNQTATLASLNVSTNTFLNNATAYSVLSNLQSFNTVGFSMINNSSFPYTISTSVTEDKASDGLRFMLEPTNPLGSNATYTASLVNVTGQNITVTYGQPVTKYGADSSSIPISFALEYKEDYANGPVPVENYPSYDLYKQTYEISFVGSGFSAQKPKQIIVKGWSRTPEVLNPPNPPIPAGPWTQIGDAKIVLLGNRGSNWQMYNDSQSTSNGVTTYTFDLAFDVMMSGVKGWQAGFGYGSSQNINTASVYIPAIVLKIPVDSAVTAPVLKVDLEVPQFSTFTHRLRLQGLKLSALPYWADIPDYQWYIDTRVETGTLFFQDGSNYNIAVGFVPSGSTLSIPYTHPLKTEAQGWSGVYWDLATNTSALNYMSSNAAAFTVANFSGMLANPSQSNPSQIPSVTLNAGTIAVVIPALNVQFEIQYSSATSDPIFFCYSRNKSILGVQSPQTNNNNFLVDNSTIVKPEPGIGITSTVFYTAPTGLSVGQFGVVTLNTDHYYATAYSGQTGAAYNSPGRNIGALVGGVYALIPNSLGGSYTTDGLTTSIVRGYQNMTAVWSRSGIFVNATFGQYNISNLSIPAVTPYELVLNMDPVGGMCNGIKFNMVASTVSYSNVYDANKTVVAGNYVDVLGNVIALPTRSSPTGLTMNQLVTNSTPAQVPWIEKLALNNFFVPGSQISVKYNQSPIDVYTAPYNCTDNALSADQYIANVAYTSSQSLTDVNLIAADYLVSQGSIVVDFANSPILRQSGQQYYVDVAPLDVDIVLKTSASASIGSSVVSTHRHVVMEGVATGVQVDVDGLIASYNFATNLNPISFVNSLPTIDVFNFKSNLYSLRGAQVPNVWYNYFTNQDLNNWTNPNGITCTLSGGIYTISLIQAGQISPNIIKFTLNSSRMLPLYSNNGWWSSLTVDPQNGSRMTVYDLSFSMNGVTKAISPVITKYVSVTHLPDQPVVNPACATAQILTSSVNNISTYPYQVPGSTALLYPAPTNTLLASPVWSNITAPAYMNVAVKVTGTPSANAYYQQYFVVANGDYTSVKLNTVFAADQLVVNNYAGLLVMRVGPDGHLYSGDVSTYSITVVDNQQLSTGGYVNGVCVPMYNSDVNLNV